jgi:two-component system, sensor histidine kinase LadS
MALDFWDWLGSGRVDLPLILTFVFAAIATIAVAWALWIRQTMAREAELLQIVRERTQQLEEANRRLEALSYTDALTNLLNRRAFDKALDLEWRRGVRSKKPLALLLIDIDHFKSFNDTYGHPAGDSCLVSVAAALGTVVRRAADTVARYGGEEFVALLPETDTPGVNAIAERMRAAVEALNIPNTRGVGGRVTVSVGQAAMVPNGGEGAATLVAAADVALYQAKRGGRNRVAAAVTVAAMPAAVRG